MVLMPNDPKANSDPRPALPFIRPFCIFLNFVLFGCNMFVFTYNCLGSKMLNSIYLKLSSALSATASAISASTVSASTVATTTMITITSTTVVASSFTTALHTGTLTYVWRKITLSVNFTFTDPDFHTDLTISSQCFCQCIVYISTESVQRNTSVFVLLGTGHFSTAQTT